MPTAIHSLWSQQYLTDTEIAETLSARGTALSIRQVQEIRLQHQMLRRNNSPETQANAYLQTLEAY